MTAAQRANAAAGGKALSLRSAATGSSGVYCKRNCCPLSGSNPATGDLKAAQRDAEIC